MLQIFNAGAKYWNCDIKMGVPTSADENNPQTFTQFLSIRLPRGKMQRKR